jgi:predicted nucleotidyltransferase
MTDDREKAVSDVHLRERQALVDAMAERIVRQFEPERIILFGSYACARATYDSDVDILVVMPIEGSQREKAREIDHALSDRTLPLDLIVVTPEQFDRMKHVAGSLIAEAHRQGKVLYERAA